MHTGADEGDAPPRASSTSVYWICGRCSAGAGRMQAPVRFSQQLSFSPPTLTSASADNSGVQRVPPARVTQFLGTHRGAVSTCAWATTTLTAGLVRPFSSSSLFKGAAEAPRTGDTRGEVPSTDSGDGDGVRRRIPCSAAREACKAQAAHARHGLHRGPPKVAQVVTGRASFHRCNSGTLCLSDPATPASLCASPRVPQPASLLNWAKHCATLPDPRRFFRRRIFRSTGTCTESGETGRLSAEATRSGSCCRPQRKWCEEQSLTDQLSLRGAACLFTLSSPQISSSHTLDSYPASRNGRLRDLCL